jgi:hypothetical protein
MTAIMPFSSLSENMSRRVPEDLFAYKNNVASTLNE